MHPIFKTLYAALMTLPLFVEALCCYEDLPKKANQLTFGPEFYHLKRVRKEGTLQHGMMYGVRGSYDHIKRYRLYWGLEAAYARGIMRGHAKQHERIKSLFSDAMVEARLGYTFQSKSITCASLTPFLGVGAFLERNHYVHPSPVKVNFENSFYYFAFGGYSRLYVTPRFSMGLNVTGKYSWDGKVKVSKDERIGKVTLHYEHKLQCRVALPFTYDVCGDNRSFALCVNPFYEFRHYGGLHQVPFNFNDTRLKVHGIDFFLVFRF